MNKQKGLLYVTLFSLTWAIQTIITKIAVNKGIEPLSFAYQTLFGAALILFLYIVLFKKNSFKKIAIKDLPKLAGIGIIGSGIGNILGFYGLKYSTSVNFGFLIKSTIVFSVILAWLFLKEKITAKKVFFIIMLLVGAYFISTKGQLINPQIGDLIILASAFCLSSANVMSKPLLGANSAEIVTLFRTFFGGLIILLIVPFIAPDFYIITDIPLSIAMSFFVFLTILFLNRTIEATNISYMTTMSMMFSLFVVILSYFILGETLNGPQAIGGLLIILSVILIQKCRDKEAL